jgi:transposase
MDQRLPVYDEEAYDFVTGLVDPNPAKKEAARRLLPEAWSGFSNGALFETAIALASGLTLDPSKGVSAQGRSKRSEQFEALTPEMLALAGRAIIGNDDGFSRLCERYRADMEKRPRHYGRRKELGPLAYITYDRHIDPTIRDLLGGLIDSNMKFTSRAHSLRTGDDADDAYLSIDGFAEEFDVRPSILRRLAQSGMVTVIKATDAKRSPVRMRIAEVKPLLEQLKDAIGENEAAGLLGLPLHVLPSLADRVLIRRLEGAVVGLVPGNAGYAKSSVEELMEKIWSAARPVRGKCRSIAVAARPFGEGATPWAAIISAIVSGDVEVFDTGARRNIRFSLAVEDTASFVAGVQKHLHGAAAGHELPEWIAGSTAAEILQVNEAFLSRLAHAMPDLLPQRGPGYTPYLASDVQTLAAKCIFVPEIARRGEMHPRRAVSWLRSKGVQPAVALQENRDLGFLRSTVEPLLTELLGDTAQMKASLAGAGDSVRVRLVAAVAAGAGTKATAEAMGVPYREAKRWVEAWREAGAVAPRKFGYRSKLDDHEGTLRQIVDERPTIKLVEIHEALAERGVKTSKTAVWNALTRFGLGLADRDARHAANVQKLLGDI